MMMLHHHVQAVKGAKGKRRNKVVQKLESEQLKAARLVIKQDIAKNNTVWVTGILTKASPQRLLKERFSEFGEVVSVTVQSKWAQQPQEGTAEERLPSDAGADGADGRDGWALVSFKAGGAMQSAVDLAASAAGLNITDDSGLTYRLDVQDAKTIQGLEDEDDLGELAVMWREQKRQISCAVKIQAMVRGRNSRKKTKGSIGNAVGAVLAQDLLKNGNKATGPLRAKSLKSGKSAKLSAANLRKQQSIVTNSEHPPALDVGDWVKNTVSALPRKDHPASAAGAGVGRSATPSQRQQDRPSSAAKQAAIVAAQKKAAEMTAAAQAAAEAEQRQARQQQRQPEASDTVTRHGGPASTGVQIGDHEYLSTELNSQLRVGKHRTFKLTGKRFASASRAVRAKYDDASDPTGGDLHQASVDDDSCQATRKLSAKEREAAERRAKKKKMLLDMAPKGLSPTEISVGMLVKVIGDLTAKGIVVEHRKTRVRVDFSSTGGPSSKWIECNLKTLLFNLEPGKSEQLVGSWARSDEMLGIVVATSDEGAATLRLGDGTQRVVAAESIKRARPTAAVLAENFWEQGSHARVGERVGVIISPLTASKIASEGKRVRMLWTETGLLSDSTIETSELQPVWNVEESRRIVRGWCKVGSFVRYVNSEQTGSDNSADPVKRLRLGVVCAHTFSSGDPAKIVEVRWADGGSDNIPGAPDRWMIGLGPAALMPARPSQEEVAREWWRVGSIARHGRSRLGMVVRAAEIENGDLDAGKQVTDVGAGDVGAYVKVIWSDGTPSGGKWKRGLPRGSVNVTSLKPAYSDEDVAAAVEGWCRPGAFVRHFGQLCEVLSYIDTTDNSVQIRYAGPAKSNRDMVTTRTTPGSGTAWVAELTPARVEGFPLWVWDTSEDAELSPAAADAARENLRLRSGAHGNRPSTAGSMLSGRSSIGMARDHRGFDYGEGRIEMVEEKARLKLPGKLNMFVGQDHPRYDKAVRASLSSQKADGREDEQVPQVMMLEDDEELSAMAAEAREAQQWLANMRKMLAEEESERVNAERAAEAAPRATAHFARDEWGAPIATEVAEAMYLEKRIQATIHQRETSNSLSNGDGNIASTAERHSLGGSAGSSRSSRSALPPIR